MSSRVVTVPAGFTIEYHDPTHTYKIDGEPVPSVSTVLNVLDKPALPWWGMKIGAAGVIALHERGLARVVRKEFQIQWTPDPRDVEKEARKLAKAAKKAGKPIELDAAVAAAAKLPQFKPRWEMATTERAVAALTRAKLTVNHVRDERGDYGTGAHRMFENWAELGVMPDPSQVVDNPEEQGRVRALLAFCEDASESYGRKTEVIVGSKRHKFAGRYDFECNLVGELLTGLSPRKTKTFTGEPCLLDVKTAKSVYETHFLQLEGYEGARLESGYEPTQFRVVVHLLPSGSYRLHRSKRDYAEFLAVRPSVEVVKKAGTRW